MPTEAPVKTPTKAPEAPDSQPWPERYYEPRTLCPDQRKDGAQKITDLAQEVCEYFHPDLYPDFYFEAVWTDREISDDEARDRIQGFQYSMDRELARYTDVAIEGPSQDPWTGWVHDVWSWRFDDDWREKHREWIAKYKEYVSTPEGFKDLYNRNRYVYPYNRRITTIHTFAIKFNQQQKNRANPLDSKL